MLLLQPRTLLLAPRNSCSPRPAAPPAAAARGLSTFDEKKAGLEAAVSAKAALVSGAVSAKKEAIEEASELVAAKISAAKEAIAEHVSAAKALVSAAKADALKPELFAKPAQPLAQGLPTKA